MEIPISNYLSPSPAVLDINPGTYFFFDKYLIRINKVNAGVKMVTLYITWKVPLQNGTTTEVLRVSPRWAKKAIDYYGQQIVGDVKIINR
ncbi:hypothetical protein ACFQ3S_17245 [Mucilaginibacter terrae]|uniref:hypothetical protein n=1 Tax=Mucilaginibacter terrae TaxID=1955052 RepID=UPI00362D6A0E